MSRYRSRSRSGRYGRSYNAGSRFAASHVSNYHSLVGRLGPIVEDVKSAFFSLDSTKLERLIKDYENQYGASAANYAKNTVYRWKTGTTKMSGQTAERLVNLVPRYLSVSQRYEIVKKLIHYHERNHRKYVTIAINLKQPNEGLQRLRQELQNSDNETTLKSLPGHVMETVHWLYDSDVTATRALLAEIEQKEIEIIRKIAAKEIQHLEELITSKSISNLHKSIEFPNRVINVSLQTQNNFCFVATVCFGTPEENVIFYLQKFREEILRKNNWGRIFICWYYSYGPKLANMLSKRTALRRLIKKFLLLAVIILRKKFPLD